MIGVENSQKVNRGIVKILLDGNPLPDNQLRLVNDD